MGPAQSPETGTQPQGISRAIYLLLGIWAAIHRESPIAQTMAGNNSKVRLPGAPRCAI